MLHTYWQIGHIIVEYEQNGEQKAQYGTKLLVELSKRLTKEIGESFSRSNLYNMREFYSLYPIFLAVPRKLTWTHYAELLSVKDNNARSFYDKEMVIQRYLPYKHFFSLYTPENLLKILKKLSIKLVKFTLCNLL